MKTISRLLAHGLVTLFTGPLLAESAFVRELDQLKDQHARAVAAATEPLKRRQQGLLEQLLRRATQANDLDAAIKIREQLTTLTATAAAADTTESKVIGEWCYEEKGTKFRQIFLKDGKLELWKNGKPDVDSDGTNWWAANRWQIDPEGIGLYGKSRWALLELKDKDQLIYKSGPATNVGQRLTKAKANDTWRASK